MSVEKDVYEVGSWYEMQGNIYVYMNKQGTVRMLRKVKWYKILFLAFLQYFGKKKHPEEVIQFLYK